MREYAAKKQPNAAKMEPNAAQPVPRGKVPIPGMSNQEMLAFLSASPKQRVSQEDGIRQKLTEKFGVDFSGLKITRNAALADIHERAYTKGNEIHLAPDVNPVSMEGQEILTHEAVHVIQQGTRSLSGGMLHDSLMEAQANDIARGAGHIDVSGFSMPTADNAPVQGFLGFIFNRFRSNANKWESAIMRSVLSFKTSTDCFAASIGFVKVRPFILSGCVLCVVSGVAKPIMPTFRPAVSMMTYASNRLLPSSFLTFAANMGKFVNSFSSTSL
jgi:hypothetical protein